MKIASRSTIPAGAEMLIMILLLTLALWLRIRNLGALGLNGDEDYVFMAVQGVLDTGQPILPSGMWYPRHLLLTYISAGSAAIFGISEFSIRLPNVLASGFVLVLLYLLTKELIGVRVAVITSALFAVSAWDIEVARHGRMYELFVLFYLGSVFCFYRGFVNGERIYVYLVPVLFILTTSIHSLGVFLLVFFAYPFLMRELRGGDLRRALGYGGGIALVDYLVMMAEAYPYREMLRDSYASADEPMWQVVSAGVLKPAISLLQGLVGAGELFTEAAGFVVLAIVVCGMGVGLWRGGMDAHSKWKQFMVSAVVCAGILLHQFGLVFCVVALLAFKSGLGFGAARNEPLRTLLAFTALGFALWFALGMLEQVAAFPEVGLGATSKGVLAALVNYPVLHARLLFDVMPLMTGVVTVALAVLFHRNSQVPNGKHIIVMIGVLGPLLAIGFLREWPWLRYLFMTYPFFLMIYAWGVVEAVDRILGYMLANRMRIASVRQTVGVLLAAVLAFVVSEHHSLVQAKGISDRTYSTNVPDVVMFTYARHPDHKNTSLFVKEHKGRGDVVIAMDILPYTYIGQIDYLIWTGGLLRKMPVERDIYIGCPTIRSGGELVDVIKSNSDKGVWLITSQELTGPHRMSPGVSPAVMDFLRKNRERIVYTGHDRMTHVYFWGSRDRFDEMRDSLAKVAGSL